MRNRFEQQLSRLNAELITMGALCEEAISKAAKYLIDHDETLREEIFETDRQIDQKERDIENLCMRMLLQQQPVARDLRVISSALKMISDMERIGDQASDITEIVPFVTQSEIGGKVHIADMARATIAMVTGSVESFVQNDVSIAYDVIERDDGVDHLFQKVKTELISSVQSGVEDAEAFIDLLMIAKYFERIGDHAENIAQWVIYSITGSYDAIKP